jgi:hypothetical protein
VRCLDTKRQWLELVYDGNSVADAPLTDVDNVTVHRRSGDLFVAEDSGNLELCVITASADWKRSEVAPFVRVAGPEDRRSPVPPSTRPAIACTSARNAARSGTCSAPGSRSR